MIELHYWPTPNSHKVTIFLEETRTPYRLKVVDLGKGEQFAPDFLKLSPNNRMPAIVDDAPAEGSEPIALFESGAILLYLAEKSGQFLPAGVAARADVVQWLFWQMAGLGPMCGQNGHFRRKAPEQIPYAIDRYTKEVNRLFQVMERGLEGRSYLAGDYSIADMAAYPWASMYDMQGVDIADFPAVGAWLDRIAERPAVQRALAIGEDFDPIVMNEETRKILLGQDGSALRTS